jgi:uncharacterized protein YdaU (DUF1376 family)
MSDLDEPFFVNIPAFKRATKGLSPEHVGLLMTLLAYRHERGALPDDPVKMLAIPGFGEQEWRRCWPGLSRFFEPHGTPWLRTSAEMEDGDYE